jgi:hypothetical protein
MRVEKLLFSVENSSKKVFPFFLSTDFGLVIHHLFTTYTNVIQEGFRGTSDVIRTFHIRYDY